MINLWIWGLVNAALSKESLWDLTGHFDIPFRDPLERIADRDNE